MTDSVDTKRLRELLATERRIAQRGGLGVSFEELESLLDAYDDRKRLRDGVQRVVDWCDTAPASCFDYVREAASQLEELLQEETK